LIDAESRWGQVSQVRRGGVAPPGLCHPSPVNFQLHAGESHHLRASSCFVVLRPGETGPVPSFSFFFFTLVTGPRRSWNLKLSDTRVYEPQIRARLGTTAHFCAIPAVSTFNGTSVKVIICEQLFWCESCGPGRQETCGAELSPLRCSGEWTT